MRKNFFLFLILHFFIPTTQGDECGKKINHSTSAMNSFLEDNNKILFKNTCSLSDLNLVIKSTLSLMQKCILFHDFKKLESISFSDYGEHFKQYFKPDMKPEHAGEFLKKFILQRIKTIEVGNVSGALAANLGLSSRLGFLEKSYPYGSIILTKDFFDMPWVKRIGTLIHEARHSDEDKSLINSGVSLDHDHHGHVECRVVRTETHNGSSDINHVGCDENISGPYGMETIFYGNVLKSCINCFTNPGTKALREYETRQGYNHSMGSVLELPSTQIF